MADKFLLINYNPNCTWIYPILNALNAANDDLKKRTEEWEKVGLSELGLALSTKLRMISIVVERIDKHLGKLSEELQGDKEKALEFYRGGYAYTVKHIDPFVLVVDLEAFIFETRSTYEIVGKFIVAFFKYILLKDITEADLTKMLEEKGIDVTWIKELQINRITFFHNTAPWIGIKPINDDLARVEVLILKKNIKELESADDYVSFDLLRSVYENFGISLNAIQGFLISEIK